VILNIVFYGISNATSVKEIFNFLLLFIMGIIFTHIYRYFILKYKIIKLQIFYQLIFIVLASIFLSALYFRIGSLFSITLFNPEVIINGVVPFVFWSLIYFGFHYLQNYKRTEIQNLRWEASSKDIELNKLKSQLNPHFMFNSMNSIRALIDENPAKAKEAVTQLSNILRNSLLMNKNKEIMLEEELRIVKDYLDLEHIRYEERLKYDFDIEEAALKKNVPPLIVQSQVENAIKHGISKLPKGGIVNVSAKITGNDLLLEVNIVFRSRIEDSIAVIEAGCLLGIGVVRIVYLALIALLNWPSAVRVLGVEVDAAVAVLLGHHLRFEVKILKWLTVADIEKVAAFAIGDNRVTFDPPRLGVFVNLPAVESLAVIHLDPVAGCVLSDQRQCA